MAIVTISRIKHRRGLMDGSPMPQLASAELGWGIDKRELYIGNGALDEGAPVEGNTRILTEDTNILSYLNDYIYEGPFMGAIMDTRPLTGPNSNTPIQRHMVSRLDDIVSIRSFGGLGDGIVDDSDAIEQALTQLYANQPSNNRYWATLYFPAGTYRITRPIQIPNHARIYGDGISASKIYLDAEDSAVFLVTNHTHDSVDYSPTDIHISKMLLETSIESSDVMIVGDATNVLFSEMGFIGKSTSLSEYGVVNACVRFSNEASRSFNLTFNRCSFSTATYGIVTGIGGVTPVEVRQDITDVMIINSYFDNLYIGIELGNSSPIGSEVPQGVRVIGNAFDNITREGFYIYKGKFCTSSQNHFMDVGNNQGGAASAPCILLGDYGENNPAAPSIDMTEYQSNYSLGDTFTRTDAENLVVPRIRTNSLKSYSIDPDEIHYGTLHIEPGRLITLLNGRQAIIPTGLTLDKTKYQGAIIDYQINRSNDGGEELRRVGTMKIAQDTNHHTFSEEYNEMGSVGISFSSTDVGNYTSIDYWSTGFIGNAVFSYSIRHLTSIRGTITESVNILPILDSVDPVYWIAPPIIPVFNPVSSIDAAMDATLIPTINAVNIDISIPALTPSISAINIDAPTPSPVPVFDSLNDVYQGIEDNAPVFDSLNDVYQGIEDNAPVFDSLNDVYQGINS